MPGTFTSGRIAQWVGARIWKPGLNPVLPRSSCVDLDKLLNFSVRPHGEKG